MKHDHSAFEAALAYAPDPAERMAQFAPLVRKLAWLFAGSTHGLMEAEDLMQIGTIALWEAARRHDRPGCDGFAAYAKLRVRGAMLDAIRAARKGSRRTRALRRQIETARALAMGESGNAPSLDELAQCTGLPATTIMAVERDHEPQFAALDPAMADIDPRFADDSEDSLSRIIEQEDQAGLADAISALPERLKCVIQLYFVEECNLAEIAAILQVSVPRVHQLKADALRRLRERLEA